MFKRGQIEMIGLVIVVILLVIGLLLYVKLSVFRQETPKEDITIQNAYVTNLMGAVFNIKICESAPVKIEEGIVKCFNGNEQICGVEACSYVKNQINTIVSNIGFKSYKNYSVWITKGGQNQTISSSCKTGILTHTTIVTPDNDHYTAYFRVC